MEERELIHEETTNEIISAFYHVYNELGFGFLEKVYQNALYVELMSRGFSVQPQKQIDVFFKGIKVGEYYSDMIVDDIVILELKAKESLAPEHEAQLLNYLKVTEIEVGLLLNFGLNPQFKRKIFTNDRKKSKRKSLD